jgi:hypothetical protein
MFENIEMYIKCDKSCNLDNEILVGNRFISD